MNKSTYKKEICIALGQGGARSLAHIGVLQVLQEANISIKHIAGTSAGAIVGAVFAETGDAFEVHKRFIAMLESEPYKKSGLGAIQDHTIHEVNLWEQISLRIKSMIALNLAQSQMGVFGNKYFKECLKILIHTKDFSQLKIPFSAMATDLIHGCGVEITSGDVMTAVNASSAIPGFFSPVKLGEHLLVDGGVCCPVPVEHCGDRKDAVIVAVHVPSIINYDFKPENAIDIVVRAEEINMRILDQLKTARADIQIFPETNNVKWNEIHKLDEMVDSGRRTARKMLPQVLKAIENKNQKQISIMGPSSDGLSTASCDTSNFSADALFQQCRKFFIKV